MIDTHCHLTDPRLFADLENVLQRAAQSGVRQMVTIGTHAGDWQDALDLCRAHSNVRCALGIHPNHTRESHPADLVELEKLLTDSAVVAAGEMGLDFHHDPANVPRQREFFEPQLQMARRLDRPVIIHSREAVDACLEMVRGYAGVRCVFHCFTGTAAEAQRITDAGHYIGFTGVVTFKNADGLRQIVRSVPADQILIETDAPYLSPEPMRRQKINEPSLVVHTAAAVAAAREITVEECDRLTTENASRFYGWERI